MRTGSARIAHARTAASARTTPTSRGGGATELRNPLDPVDDASRARSLLRSGARITVRVATGSMAPTLPAGSLVTVRPGAAKVGEVALLVEDVGGRPRLVLHRVVLRVVALPGRGRVVHQGDAVAARAYLCREDQLLGVAEVPRVDVSLRRALVAAAAVVARRCRRLLRDGD